MKKLSAKEFDGKHNYRFIATKPGDGFKIVASAAATYQLAVRYFRFYRRENTIRKERCFQFLDDDEYRLEYYDSFIGEWLYCGRVGTRFGCSYLFWHYNGCTIKQFA